MCRSVCASISCTVTRTRSPTLRTLPSRTYSTSSSRATSWTFTALPLCTKAELREMTRGSRKRDSSVMMSSVRPSAKNSCSGSPLILTSGSTAMDGFLVMVIAAELSLPFSGAAGASGSSRTRKTWIGRVMFLTLWIAEILKCEVVEPVADLIAHRARDRGCRPVRRTPAGAPRR